MARVTLDYGAAYRGELPPVCVRCGTEATEYRTKMFSISPFGIPVIVLPCWVVIFPGRVWVRLPFCSVHRNYWVRRLALISAGLIGAILLGCVGFPMMIDADPNGRTRIMGKTGAFLCLASLVGLVLWAVLTIWFQRTGIRLARRDRATITLANVSEAFLEAVEDPRG